MKTMSSVCVHDNLQKAPQEPPPKFITTQVEVQLACRLLFIDLEGLNDGRAVKTIIPQVNPRKMVSASIALMLSRLITLTDRCSRHIRGN